MRKLFRPEVARKLIQDRSGQVLFEYVLALPAFILLILFIGVFSWYWWNQSVAAVAIHDGVRAAGAYGSNLEAGQAVVEDRLSVLGIQAAESYEGTWRLRYLPGTRSVRGNLMKETTVSLPFIPQPLTFRIRASSFQRDWAFYGGPSGGWD